MTIPEINRELRTEEEVAEEQDKLRRGKCLCKDCEKDVAGDYKLCREHILPLLDVMHNNQWISDRSFMVMCGAPEELIEEYGRTIKYGFELKDDEQKNFVGDVVSREFGKIVDYLEENQQEPEFVYFTSREIRYDIH